ncbi:MAG: hypothetical protein CMK92_00465, partial [Pseudomonas sp.]|nr:hypothetical protein [Pseudomonas sp.]
MSDDSDSDTSDDEEYGLGVMGRVQPSFSQEAPYTSTTAELLKTTAAENKTVRNKHGNPALPPSIVVDGVKHVKPDPIGTLPAYLYKAIYGANGAKSKSDTFKNIRKPTKVSVSVFMQGNGDGDVGEFCQKVDASDDASVKTEVFDCVQRWVNEVGAYNRKITAYIKVVHEATGVKDTPPAKSRGKKRGNPGSAAEPPSKRPKAVKAIVKNAGSAEAVVAVAVASAAEEKKDVISAAALVSLAKNKFSGADMHRVIEVVLPSTVRTLVDAVGDVPMDIRMRMVDAYVVMPQNNEVRTFEQVLELFTDDDAELRDK